MPIEFESKFEPNAPAANDAIESAPRRAMWINPDRVFYVGLLGKPSVRSFGAWSIYFSQRQPHHIRVEGRAGQETCLSVVPPYAPHCIATTERMICVLLIESESVQEPALPDYLRNGRGAVPMHESARNLRDALTRILQGGELDFSCTEDFDQAVFGAALPVRLMDRRIRAVIERIKNNPNGHISGEECAHTAHLSISRFLHLFKSETGAPFRKFRSWQRARSLLYHVTRDTSLVNIALDAGYPDSTHFSHSIRQFYGLTPKAIFAGSRKLTLYGSNVAASPRYALN